MRIHNDSPQQTQKLGEALSHALRPGDVVLLTGPMGAGKSELARGIAKGMGFLGPITSPTFTILNVYQEAGQTLHHFDWYRVDDEEELLQSGLDEFIGGEAVTLIEWHERAPSLLPADCLEVVIRPEGESGRAFQLISHGAFRQIELDEASFLGDTQ